MDTRIKGSCLCGAVQYSIEAEPAMVGDCYCLDCRKSSGTAHCTHVAVVASAYNVSGGVSFYERAADSGNMVRRGFCPTCGSPVHSTNQGMPGMVFVRASTLGDPEQISPQMTVYARRAPRWARIDHDKPVFDGMATEVAARVAGDGRGVE